MHRDFFRPLAIARGIQTELEPSNTKRRALVPCRSSIRVTIALEWATLFFWDPMRIHYSNSSSCNQLAKPVRFRRRSSKVKEEQDNRTAFVPNITSHDDDDDDDDGR